LDRWKSNFCCCVKKLSMKYLTHWNMLKSDFFLDKPYLYIW
jgi:hypothetical protein